MTLVRTVGHELVRWFRGETRRRIWLFGHPTRYLTNALSRNGNMNFRLGAWIRPHPSALGIVLDEVVHSMAMTDSAEGQNRPDPEGHPLFARPEVQEAWAFIRSIDPWVLDRQMELTAIPAPPFEEEARGKRMAELFLDVGLEGVRTDQVGNVLGALSAEGTRSPDPN
ncbi:MAG: hypothetical protein ABIF09_01385, partial [Gemmatimonadota bacterium]